MQVLAQSLGGKVTPARVHEYGRSQLHCHPGSLLIPEELAGTNFHAWMSHGDIVTAVPVNFSITASNNSCPIAAMENQTVIFSDYSSTQKYITRNREVKFWNAS